MAGEDCKEYRPGSRYRQQKPSFADAAGASGSELVDSRGMGEFEAEEAPAVVCLTEQSHGLRAVEVLLQEVAEAATGQ